MKFEFTNGDPITEEEAIAEAAAMGLHIEAFDSDRAEDTELHWHDFEVNVWLISGEASYATADGTVYEAKPGCRLKAPAGWVHQELMSPTHRMVTGTNIPRAEWTEPVKKPVVELSA